MRVAKAQAAGNNQLLQQWNRSENGAVAIAALAACIVLLMMGAALWDVGQTVRAKTKLQTATDSAAYTKASIEARTMNYMSFSNVAKRSIVGLHNSYHAYIAAWDTATLVRCAMAACCFALQPYCCDYCALSDCLTSWAFYYVEMPDYTQYSGRPMTVPGQALSAFVTPMKLWGDSKTAFGEELKGLTNFQEYMSGITPWWSFLASSMRGARNGATVTTSWPPPPVGAQSTFGINYTNFKTVLNAVTALTNSLQDGNSAIPPLQMPTLTDGIPVGLAGTGNMRQTCLFPLNGPTTFASGVEFAGNYALHWYMSDNVRACTQWANPRGPHMPVAAAALASVACQWAPYRNDNFRDSTKGMNYMAPMLGVGMGIKKQNEINKSTFVFGYRHLEHADPEKFAFNPEYESSNTWSTSSLPGGIGGGGGQHYEPSGLWSIARAEFTSPKKLPKRTGNGNTWMWHTGWTARMRPLSYRDELAVDLTRFGGLVPGFSGVSTGAGRVSVRGAFMDVSPLMFLQAQAFSMFSDFDVSNLGEVTRDFGYMLDKGSRSMDNNTVHSVPK